MTDMLRIEVLNDHKSHVRVVWQSLEQTLECVQTSGRTPDTDYGEKMTSRRTSIVRIGKITLNLAWVGI
ncbi:MAG TPA: hypothetical protein VGM43_18710 [Bryobacteraceae bacterium]